MPSESVHPTSGVRRKRLLRRPKLRLGLHREEDMSTAKTRRARPAASPACDIAPPSYMGWRNSRYSTWFVNGEGYSPDKSLSFEIDDATFMECLVNDVGSPDDVPQRRHFLARTPPRKAEVTVAGLQPPSPVCYKAKKKVTFASNGAAAAKAKAKSMPDLVDVPAAQDTSSGPQLRNSSRPEQKAGARNSFVFAAFSRLQFTTKRSGSFTSIAPTSVDQR
ncbi:uncharacterized protein LOC144107576 [Amblyomma americanum]